MTLSFTLYCDHQTTDLSTIIIVLNYLQRPFSDENTKWLTLAQKEDKEQGGGSSDEGSDNEDDDDDDDDDDMVSNLK